MRRASKNKVKKSDPNSDSEAEVDNSVADNNETDTVTEADTLNSSGKKRNARGQLKASTENESDNDEEKSGDEASPSKRKKKASNEVSENGRDESDEEAEKSEKPVNKRKKNKPSKTSDKNDEAAVLDVEQNGKSPSKGKKKGKTVQKKEEKQEDEEEYEVEKIVDQRTIKGRRQFLVRWKGYSEESDTWENEKDLNCDRLIEEFLTEQDENELVEEKKDKTESKTKCKKQDKRSKNQKKNNKAGSKEDEHDDSSSNDEKSTSSKEYEVGRIIDVYFKKDRTRDFLIRWKGFSAKEDTWEPEAHLNCPELISKFMEKVEKNQSTDSRELRMNPSHTKRYTLTMHADKRQSRRNASKQRVTYFECDG